MEGDANAGVYIRDDPDIHFKIINVSVLDGGGINHGFNLWGVHIWELINNTAEGNNNGFHILGCNNSTLKNNIAINNTSDGFILWSSLGNTAENNTALENDVGFHLESASSGNTFEWNTSVNNSGYGFELANSDQNTFTNNLANENANDNGFYLQNSNFTVITENTANNNTSSGIFLKDSYNNTVSRNMLVGNDYCVNESSTVSEEEMNNTIENNYCDDSEISVPHPFEVTSNAGDPDPDGSFTINWTESTFADNYTIYQDNVKLEEGLTESGYNITDLTTGTYTFKVVAYNDNGETESIPTIEVQIEEGDEDGGFIPGYNILFLLSITGILSAFTIILTRKKIRV